MKKLGFTLAEILITLGIVGIVASLTVPGLVASSKNDIYASTLATVVSALEGGFTSAITAENKQYLSETSLWDLGALNSTATNAQRQQFVGRLNKYMIINGYENQGQNNVYNNTIGYELTNNGTQGNSFVIVDGAFAAIPIEMKNGAVVFIRTFIRGSDDAKVLEDDELIARGTSLQCDIADVFIDVNGASPPNTIGRDIFAFYTGDNGVLYPAGSKDVVAYDLDNFGEGTVITDWSDPENGWACTENVKGNSGWGCTARLVAKNYKMDY